MSIIIKPLVTEKITTAGEKFNRYGFLVDPKADKALIRTAIRGYQSAHHELHR
jgi:large subunit ribosomal protein L23